MRRSNLTVEIRASRNRIFCGDIFKSKTVDLEVSVVGGFLWQLWQTHRVEQGGKGECRIKIKLTNIHSLNVGTGQRIGFGGDGKLLKEVSGGKDFKLETDCRCLSVKCKIQYCFIAFMNILADFISQSQL